jgi:hypothetical protein
MEKAESLPVGAPVMAPLADVLYRGVIAAPQEDHAPRKGMVCVKFTPPVAIAALTQLLCNPLVNEPRAHLRARLLVLRRQFVPLLPTWSRGKES